MRLWQMEFLKLKARRNLVGLKYRIRPDQIAPMDYLKHILINYDNKQYQAPGKQKHLINDNTTENRRRLYIRLYQISGTLFFVFDANRLLDIGL
ncbi:hypothetical protein DCM91_06985 [Chitinophaga costaii]|nr:hypothetical protein DCM91_06985 [Chitinophaga costaii]